MELTEHPHGVQCSRTGDFVVLVPWPKLTTVVYEGRAGETAHPPTGAGLTDEQIRGIAEGVALIVSPPPPPRKAKR